MYPLVNGLHILGIAWLVGAITGYHLLTWRGQQASGWLLGLAATGLSLAFITGLLLFSVQATDYADSTVFRVKGVLLALALLNAGLDLWRRGRNKAAILPASLVAIISLTSWTAVLLAGRLIAYS